MIMAGPNVRTGICETPISLVDLSATIADHFGESLRDDAPGSSLYDIVKAPDEPEREVFSEYHAAGAVTGAFMLRKGRWKLIHYVGFEPELFDLHSDPEEITNRATDPAAANVLADMTTRLYAICNPEDTDKQAHADQAAMIESYGGREAALKLGAPAATPPPDIQP
jgi:choline-sulfatase